MSVLTEGKDYQVIDDGMGDARSYLQQTGQNALQKAISFADRVLSGHKGKAATMAILLAELAPDKQGFNSTYRKHASAINEYFEYVDLQALSKAVSAEQTIAKSFPKILGKTLGILSVGILLGTAGHSIYKKYY